MKIAIIGYGGMGGYHAYTIKNGNEKGYTDVTVKGVYDIDETRMAIAKEQGYYPYQSLEEAVSDPEIGGVLIATPNDVHLPVLKAAAEHKKHVLCEKPVACSLAEAEEMYKIVEENGVTLTVHQNRRYDKDYLAMKQIADEGKIGRVYKIESVVSGSNGIPGDWRKIAKQGGGMMLDWGVHLLDQMYMKYGMPDKISCRYSYIYGEEVDDGFDFLAQYNSGLSYRVVVETNCFIKRDRWLLYGEDGSAVIRDWDLNGEIAAVKIRDDKELAAVKAGNGLTKTMAARRSETIDKYPVPVPEVVPCEYYNNFKAVVNGESEPITKKSQILSVMKIMENAALSAKNNGKTVEMKEN